MHREPSPEPRPLTTTICRGSLSESIRVQLFSRPQQTQANSTSNAPVEKDRLCTS